MPADLLVSEIFGPTIQGEGRSIGRPAIFLRLATCNLKCVWCDTKYTWDWENYARSNEIEVLNYEEISTRIFEKWDRVERGLLVVTGGEPLMQWVRLYPLLSNLVSCFDVEIETSGSIKPGFFRNPHIRFNVSPKLANSGNSVAAREPRALDLIKRIGLGSVKFVLVEPSDIGEVVQIVTNYSIPLHKIYLMPEGIDSKTLDERMKWLVPLAISLGYKVTDRLHIRLWGDERGR